MKIVVSKKENSSIFEGKELRGYKIINQFTRM
jgi:hypothetical protein